MENYLINIVLGNSLNAEMNNMINLYSNIIPRVGDYIRVKKFGKVKVNEIIINYTHIECDNFEDRGSEMIFALCE